MRVRLVGDKVQRIKVNESLLAFLEIVGDRRGDVIVIDLLRVLHIAYESIGFKELLDKLYTLEAEICSKVMSRYVGKMPDVLEKSTIALTESIAALDEKLLAKVEVPDNMKGLPHEILVKVTCMDLEEWSSRESCLFDVGRIRYVFLTTSQPYS